MSDAFFSAFGKTMFCAVIVTVIVFICLGIGKLVSTLRWHEDKIKRLERDIGDMEKELRNANETLVSMLRTVEQIKRIKRSSEVASARDRKEGDAME